MKLSLHTNTLSSALLALALAGTAPAPAAAATPAAHSKAKAKKAKPAKAVPAKKTDYEGEFVNFGQWKEVGQFLDEMAAKHGFDRKELEATMMQVRYVDSAVQLMKPAPPGKPKNWQAYSKLFIEPVRINGGVKFWNENREALARAEALYGVPAEIIVGIIGVETVYGSNTGRFRVMDALTTLAFAYPLAPAREARMAFFKGELESTLLYARQAGIDPFSLLGSYAGAVGLPQFMPSNIMKYAVDFDGNGRVDLRNSPTDAIGSVAAFLVAHGWRRDDPGPLVYAATVSPSRQWERFINQGLEAKFRPQDLMSAGVVTTSTLPEGMNFGLVDLQNGSEPTEFWLGSNNFFSITQYNRSYFYAMSVLELGRAIKLSRRDL
ncbi:lytic murein transglycosylase B [Pseudoduganella aquatica]|uniref:Lytic murein transglycosylase B n=1 Tax=Pseudoduganella aquatica TaxID=2660641 RepID=A0A7X4HAT0_9BURK|nr:lytic murein transglycosylase B [Pseudoduganella aquatica]MYN07388.1 lytic murein transglycosylase B [Pseudoduganella aquatica]